MTHLSPTLDAPVIPNSSLPGQRKLLLLFLRCCYCFPIHKEKVSWWPLMAPAWVPQTAHSCTTEDFLAIVTPAAITGYGQSREAGGGLYGCFEKMCEIGVWVLRVLAQSGVYCAGGWAPYWHPWSLPLTQKLCSAPCVFFLSTSFSLRHLPLLLSLTPLPPVSVRLRPSAPLSLRESGQSSRSPVGVCWIHTNSCEWRQVTLAVFHVSVNWYCMCVI